MLLLGTGMLVAPASSAPSPAPESGSSDWRSVSVGNGATALQVATFIRRQAWAPPIGLGAVTSGAQPSDGTPAVGSAPGSGGRSVGPHHQAMLSDS